MQSSPEERAKLECERHDLLLVEKKLYRDGEFFELMNRFKKKARRSATLDGALLLLESVFLLASCYAFGLNHSIGPVLLLLQLGVVVFQLPGWILSLREFRRCSEIIEDFEIKT